MARERRMPSSSSRVTLRTVRTDVRCCKARTSLPTARDDAAHDCGRVRPARQVTSASARPIAESSTWSGYTNGDAARISGRQPSLAASLSQSVAPTSSAIDRSISAGERDQWSAERTSQLDCGPCVIACYSVGETILPATRSTMAAPIYSRT